MNSKNPIRVLELVIKHLAVPVTRKSVNEEIYKHPQPFSLLALSETLGNWNIATAAYNLTYKELLATNLPHPFIVCLDGEFAVLTDLTDASVIVSNEKWNSYSLPIEEFKQLYKGTILLCKADRHSGEHNYRFQRRKERIGSLRLPAFIAILSLIFTAFLQLNRGYLSFFSWQIAFISALKIAGLITSVFLLIQSIDNANPLVHRICGNDDTKKCNAILASDAAKITDEISWSEVGFFYFAGTLLTLFFFNRNSSLSYLLALLNLVCLPYTFYSIYYQWRIAKQWCIFCCTVQALLWLEFIAFSPFLFSTTHWFLTGRDICSLTISLLSPIGFWLVAKPYFLKAVVSKQLQLQLNVHKYDKDLFRQLLHRNNKYALLEDEQVVVLGNREADTTITIVSSPFCRHCSQAHLALDDLLRIRDNIKLQFVFIRRFAAKEFDEIVIEHFLKLKNGRSDTALKNALHNWFSQKKKDYENWKQEHPVEFGDISGALKSQKEWCRLTEITGTPTVFINGRRLPEAYKPEDLKYVI